ncbi:MAG TPA: GNAT family N-acetyltransferase [Thermoplasmata archaeon]|nr:GNAT family N-acetyltransferase [Thermoplasmata archaeon]
MAFEFLSPDRLTDGVVDLVIESREPADPEKGHAPMYRYRIELHGSGDPVGQLRFRVGHTPLLEMAGHLGYQVEEAHRGHGYAERACRLVRSVALAHGFDRLRITLEPSNAASRRTVEKLGAEYRDTVELPADHPMFREDRQRLRRYDWTIRSSR